MASLSMGCVWISNLHTVLYSSGEGYCVCLHISQAMADTISVRMPLESLQVLMHSWVFRENCGILKFCSQLEKVTWFWEWFTWELNLPYLDAYMKVVVSISMHANYHLPHHCLAPKCIYNIFYLLSISNCWYQFFKLFICQIQKYQATDFIFLEFQSN